MHNEVRVMSKLKVQILKNREELGRASALEAALRLNQLIDEKGEATVVFAAAPSQNEFLKNLLQADVDWTRVRAMHQDEYIDLDPAHRAGFGNFLDRAIFKKLPFKEIFYLRGGDAESIIARYEELLQQYPPDIIFLGIGENGHLAFNDPAVANFKDPQSVKVVSLDEVCRRQQVNDGCFDCLEQVPTHALSFTMSQIMRIPQALAMVPDGLKAQSVHRALTGEISTECPASILREHPNALLYLDTDSAALLTADVAGGFV